MSPRTKSKRRSAPLCLALGLIIMLCGVVVRTASPYAQRQIEAASAPTPSAAPASTPTPVPVPSATYPTDRPALAQVTQAPTLQPTASPAAIIASAPSAASTQHDAMPTFVPSTQTAAARPTPAETVSPAVTQQVTAAPTASPIPADEPTPIPGPTPTYAYETGGTRVEVVRHEIKNVTYFTAEIWLADAAQLRSAFSSDRFDSATEPVRDIALRNDAVLAINGDFATFNSGGIIIRNGELFRANRSTRQLLVIDQNGDFQFYATPPEDPKEAADAFLAEGVLHTLVFGPVLVENGEPVPIADEFFLSDTAREPRTVLMQLGPLHYMFLVVDGRKEGYSQGVSLPRLQELCVAHGAVAAFNLDGGGSSTLFFDGDIINRPAGGGQRHVSDILFIPR